MLKVRIIPTLLFKNFGLVKGVRFDSWRRIGTVMQSVKVYNMREVDELIFLDISATQEGRKPDFETVDDIADECFMPLTVGGGIQTIDDIRQLLSVGADKVAINTVAIENLDFIQSASKKFGSQCIVVSIDAKKLSDGHYEVFTRSGTKPTGKSPEYIAKKIEESGAGEILLTSIDRDGTMSGYDVDLIRQVSGAVSVPVIASGGAGNYAHMLQAICEGNAAAIAAASIFQFTEQTPVGAKIFLKEHNINTRI